MKTFCARRFRSRREEFTPPGPIATHPLHTAARGRGASARDFVMADIEVDYCVVGAGFAGLTAALRLKQAGQSVALVEARDRIGGRTFTEVREDGSWIDRGGAWIGPGQDRIYALMDEFGVKSYKQYTDGESMMVV